MADIFRSVSNFAKHPVRETRTQLYAAQGLGLERGLKAHRAVAENAGLVAAAAGCVEAATRLNNDMASEFLVGSAAGTIFGLWWKTGSIPAAIRNHTEALKWKFRQDHAQKTSDALELLLDPTREPKELLAAWKGLSGKEQKAVLEAHSKTALLLGLEAATGVLAVTLGADHPTLSAIFDQLCGGIAGPFITGFQVSNEEHAMLQKARQFGHQMEMAREDVVAKEKKADGLERTAWEAREAAKQAAERKDPNTPRLEEKAKKATEAAKAARTTAFAARTHFESTEKAEIEHFRGMLDALHKKTQAENAVAYEQILEKYGQADAATAAAAEAAQQYLDLNDLKVKPRPERDDEAERANPG